MNRKQDYTGRSFLITVFVILFLLGISRIPKVTFGKTTLKKINILSDLIQDEHEPIPETNLYFDTTFLAEGEALEAEARAAADSQAEKQTAQTNARTVQATVPHTRDDSRHESSAEVQRGDSAAEQPPAPVVERIGFLEDFGTDGPSMLHFYDALLKKEGKRPVRIAVLGDSFIEGDIITADIREQLQDLYGGGGVGFVPFSSPIAQFRGTVRHTFDGWTTLDVKNARQAPEEYRDKFFVSGSLCIPDESASVQMKGVMFRKHIDRASVARLIFTNRERTTIHVTINDTIHKVYNPEPGPEVQQIDIHTPIRSLEVRIANPAGFIGYGIVFENKNGVSLDNYSIRGNSGLALFGTNAAVNARIGAMRGYDLIILQYGLNVMSADVLHYGSYEKAFIKVINYMKRCFPNSSILVMGVCDRSTQRDGEFVTMPAVRGMIEAQRASHSGTLSKRWEAKTAWSSSSARTGRRKTTPTWVTPAENSSPGNWSGTGCRESKRSSSAGTGSKRNAGKTRCCITTGTIRSPEPSKRRRKRIQTRTQIRPSRQTNSHNHDLQRNTIPANNPDFAAVRHGVYRARAGGFRRAGRLLLSGNHLSRLEPPRR